MIRSSRTGLFEADFAWAKKQGLNRIIGPKGFSALDGLGLLDQRFRTPPGIWHSLQPPILPML